MIKSKKSHFGQCSFKQDVYNVLLDTAQQHELPLVDALPEMLTALAALTREVYASDALVKKVRADIKAEMLARLS